MRSQLKSLFQILPMLLLVIVLIASAGFYLPAYAQDSPQWGEFHTRNMISKATGLPSFFNPETGENIKWTASLGSHGYSTPVVSGGKVLIGANNAEPRDPSHQGDRGIVYCFNESDGSLCWQLVVPRILGDRHNDWPMISICSEPTVEKGRAYVLTNRSEVLCLDMNGQADGNDGTFQGEAWHFAPEGELPYKVTKKDADILWCYDLRRELGIGPHDSPHASILMDGNILYLNTCNGVDYRHLETTGINAPSLIALDKRNGRLLAKDNEHFGPRIYHSAWSSPSMAEINGQKQIFFAGPDGILYAFEALPQTSFSDKVQLFKKIWQFDCDPTAPKKNIHDYKKNREEGPSTFMGMPVIYNNRIYVTVGGDIWWGKRKCWLKCIDATKKGDVTSTSEIWSYDLEVHSTSTPAISNGLVYVTDCGKNLHCVDAENGKVYWKHELKMDSWSSALVADKKVYVGSRGGDLWILDEGKKLNVLCSAKLNDPIYSTPVAANGTVYISTMSRLYAIKQN